ncbi:MAG: amidohydrolase, partial [Bacteroidota bacterium]
MSKDKVSHHYMKRRDFLRKSIATGASGLFMSSAIGRALANLEGPADLVVRNAKVTTIDPQKPSAQAFAIKDGLFYRIGNNASVSDLIGSNTKVIDAKGHRVIPGLNDSHTHGVREGL